MSYHIAVDIGASSGRLIVVSVNDKNVFEWKEVHRFSNQFKNNNGFDRWDIDYLFNEIIKGLKKAKNKGVSNCTLGIDTWAVDYCLIDKDGELINQPISYRDDRTIGTMEKVFKEIPREMIYKKTGIQFQNFNTLYQLYVEDRNSLEQTDKILLIPDYLTYLLTGKATNELTNLSTTQLFNVQDNKLDKELLNLIDISQNKFPEIIEPGTVIGSLKKELHDENSLPNCKVIAVGTHDTASAIAGVPATNDRWAYISSGTWSLLGVENSKPIISKASLQANYTNEKGVYSTYRFLKNIPGMWFIQEIARVTNYKYSYVEMAEKAADVEPYQQIIDLNDSRFVNPDNMITEIQEYCAERELIIPQTMGELTMCIYSNLSISYAKEIEKLENITNKNIDQIHIVGGGANIDLLNQLTANLSNKKVIAGPGEATAIGNIVVQLIADGHFEDLVEARGWLSNQLSLKEYLPLEVTLK